MQPRLPRLGNRALAPLVISSPNKTAGGPFRHDSLQGGLGTYGSSMTPAPLGSVGDAGVGAAQAGGVAGSGNAGVGNWNLGPLLCVKHGSPNPEVGEAWTIREPVGSIAGSRNRLQPPATVIIISPIPSHANRPLGSGPECERTLMAAGWFICPWRGPTLLTAA